MYISKRSKLQGSEILDFTLCTAYTLSSNFMLCDIFIDHICIQMYTHPNPRKDYVKI